MRICILSNFRGSLEEGMMNVSFHISEGLSNNNHEVLHVNARDSVLSFKVWRRISGFDPEIVHTLLRPSMFTFLLSRLLKHHSPNAKIVFSALQPPKGFFNMRLASMLKPDLVLTQSSENEKLFTRLGCKTFFLPNGVDSTKFMPVSENEKSKLKEKHGISPDKFVILHVGHLLKGRNIEVLSDLQEENNQVVVIGSTVFEPDKNICSRLRDRDCLVWNEYFPNIQEAYGLADCYVFPTTSNYSCIDIPLSVMEAMSCNLPVISSRFGMLPQIFPVGDGLFYVGEDKGFQSELKNLKTQIAQNSMVVQNRKKVLPYSWENVVSQLENAYALAFS